MDEIHDMIMQFKTDNDDIFALLQILDKMNDKMNRIEAAASRAANTASCLANGIQPD